jgi:hypothetical protein
VSRYVRRNSTLPAGFIFSGGTVPNASRARGSSEQLSKHVGTSLYVHEVADSKREDIRIVGTETERHRKK